MTTENILRQRVVHIEHYHTYISYCKRPFRRAGEVLYIFALVMRTSQHKEKSIEQWMYFEVWYRCLSLDYETGHIWFFCPRKNKVNLFPLKQLHRNLCQLQFESWVNNSRSQLKDFENHFQSYSFFLSTSIWGYSQSTWKGEKGGAMFKQVNKLSTRREG